LTESYPIQYNPEQWKARSETANADAVNPTKKEKTE